jgi:hypothetical protein
MSSGAGNSSSSSSSAIDKRLLVNLISDESLGKMEEHRILKAIFHKSLGLNVGFLWIHINYSEIPPADINIHLRDINNIAFTVAPVNVFIPDATTFRKSWISYLHKFDFIWCKNANIFDKFRGNDELRSFSKTRIIHFPWVSRDLLGGVENAEIRRTITTISPLKQIVCFVGDNPYRITPLRQLLESWTHELLPINVYLQRENPEIERLANSARGVSVAVGHISNQDHHKIIARSAYVLNVAEIETFPTTISEALQFGRGVIFPAFDLTAENRIMNSIYEDAVAGSTLPGIIRLPIAKMTKREAKEFNADSHTFIGPKIKIDIPNSINILRRVKDSPIPNSHTLQDLWKSIRTNVFRGQRPQIEAILPLVLRRISAAADANYRGNGYNYDKLEFTDEELPTVSIITPTYNRRQMFPLAIYNYLN